MNKAEELIETLQSLNYPFSTENTEVFLGSINSPTQLRYDTLEWLFSLMEPEILTKMHMIHNDQISLLLLLFKMFGINETKDNITAMSSEENNSKCLFNLISFTMQYIKTKNDIKDSTSELTQTIQIINFLHKHKVELFKENIRLFLPEIQLIEQQTKENVKKINVKLLQENIEGTKSLITKVEAKMDKLNQLSLNYDMIDRDDSNELKEVLIVFDKALDIFLKDFNMVYEKEIKYIADDKIGKLHLDCEKFMSSYIQLEKVAFCLEEIFALHNKLATINIA